MASVESLLESANNPTDKEEAFVDFLLVSPSYQLAHKHRTVGLTKEEKQQQPIDFKKVLQVYDACGDVINQSFDSWWNKRGRELLRASQPKSNLIVYPVDLNTPAAKLIRDFSQFVTEIKVAKKDKPSPISILHNKIKLGALHVKLELINEKGRLESLSDKRIEHWRLAIQTGLKSKWKADLTPNSKRTTNNEEARTTLGVLVSKHLKEALWIAENAARGEFPSLKPIDTGLELDFEATYLFGKTPIGIAVKERYKKKISGERVRKTYYERKVKPAINLQKKIDALVEARLKIERLKEA